MFKIKELKDNAIHKSLLKVLDGRNILFLENDYGLHHCDGNLELWLIENKIKYNALYNVQALPMDYIIDMINWYDVIAFQSTWTYEHSLKIKEHVAKMKDKKTIVECYISEPTWYHKPKGVVHDIYVLNSYNEDMDDWEFKKLRLNKAIWED